ncbi:hypothetical protein B0H19DRAFT_687758 [Mycena capillaripes]|nr:hypothetical protein B0H19DRAFT_687758 [Mycena capillaripes]
MPPKRKVLVAFEEDLPGSDQKRQRKIAVSIDPNATNAELVKEIADAFDTPATMTLEFAGGFELRAQDGVDMIGDNDIVIARSISIADSDIPQSHVLVPSSPSAPAQLPPSEDLDTVKRFKIAFVTAEHAATHAKETPRDQSEPESGVFGFDGEFVSQNTTLRDLKNEAARVLEWTSPDAMDVEPAVCVHEREGGCSCNIAQEIERYGLSTTFHCRLTVDGSRCGHTDCPYSHVELTNIAAAAAPPHCTICMDALAFPCPGCLARAESNAEEPASVKFCPLVQNAGCGHLHHAHCVGPRNSPAAASCPSGCPIARFPREAIDFRILEPHVIIAWDGDKIDRIPVPLPTGDVVTLDTNAMISLVERFLQEHQFALPGLCLRVHFRDPVTEAVRFTGSTLLSVCPSSSHLNQAFRRFPLFQTMVPKAIQPNPTPFSVDLHTSHAPIVACGCTQIKELFSSPSTETSSLETVLLYVVKRKTESAAVGTPEGRRRRASSSCARVRCTAIPACHSHARRITAQQNTVGGGEGGACGSALPRAERLLVAGPFSDHEPRDASLRNGSHPASPHRWCSRPPHQIRRKIASCPVPS